MSHRNLVGEWPDPLGGHLERLRDLLKPLGYTIGLVALAGECVARITWGVTVRAKGSFWDGEFMQDAHEIEMDFYGHLVAPDAERDARAILWAANRKLFESPPPAEECDWRSNEVTPEDFYAM